jgi:hypothetical protein
MPQREQGGNPLVGELCCLKRTGGPTPFYSVEGRRPGRQAALIQFDYCADQMAKSAEPIAGLYIQLGKTWPTRKLVDAWN